MKLQRQTGIAFSPKTAWTDRDWFVPASKMATPIHFESLVQRLFRWTGVICQGVTSRTSTPTLEVLIRARGQTRVGFGSLSTFFWKNYLFGVCGILIQETMSWVTGDNFGFQFHYLSLRKIIAFNYKVLVLFIHLFLKFNTKAFNVSPIRKR